MSRWNLVCYDETEFIVKNWRYLKTYRTILQACKHKKWWRRDKHLGVNIKSGKLARKTTDDSLEEWS